MPHRIGSAQNQLATADPVILSFSSQTIEDGVEIVSGRTSQHDFCLGPHLLDDLVGGFEERRHIMLGSKPAYPLIPDLKISDTSLELPRHVFDVIEISLIHFRIVICRRQ